MNETDLRAVLDERSVFGRTDVRSHLMLERVHYRVRVRRQRRQLVAVATAILAVAALIAGLAGITTSRHAITPAVRPSSTIPTINGFPEYAEGARVIGTTGPLPAGETELSMSFTTRTANMVFFFDCAANSDERTYQVMLNGVLAVQASDCGTFQTVNAVPVNRPNSLVVKFPKGPIPGFAIAVGQQVPVDDYVFPPDPLKYKPLQTSQFQTSGHGDRMYRTAKIVRADLADNGVVQTYTFTWKGSLAVMMTSQTAGQLTLSLDGVVLSTTDWWDYNQLVVASDSTSWTFPAAHRPKIGQQVKLSIAPDRMSGDWLVAIQQPV